ncbi:MAG: response regulator [Deltaproteobacteria bacterium]|nr:response regulator [Deltaproteobacteria bacterium]MBF0523690.1 response regulator [Deltaproteobacteria bacterium]
MMEKIAVKGYQTQRILVVDDEKRIREGCRKVLTQEGFEVAEAESGTISLEMIEREHFDVVLLDLMMPALSGFDVLTHIKAVHPDTTIIVISGYATVEHSIEAMKKGAFDFIPKPFSPEQLRVVVAKAIDYTSALKDVANEKSRMRAIINHLSDGVMVADNRKSVVLANPAFLKMVGYQGTEAIGRRISELTHNHQLEQMVDKSLSMQENDFVELCEELSSAGESADGTSGATTVLTARCVPFRDRIGRNLGAVTLLHDITTLKKMDQLKSDFVSMVAHEIRSPLNTVLMQLKVVLDGLAGELTHKQHEFLDRATEKIKGLISLATELLDLAKIESGLLSQERRQINLVAFLNDQVAFHLPRAQAKNIALSLQPPVPPVPPLLANQQNMEEVFGNLISNAINYTPEGGTIILAVTVAGDCVCISVADTGIGIPEEDLERIFERFYRVKDESTKYVIGTGLGLAIVKSIVESHHGRISVTSQPGQGTTFSVHLPLVTS